MDGYSTLLQTLADKLPFVLYITAVIVLYKFSGRMRTDIAHALMKVITPSKLNRWRQKLLKNNESLLGLFHSGTSSFLKKFDVLYYGGDLTKITKDTGNTKKEPSRWKRFFVMYSLYAPVRMFVICWMLALLYSVLFLAVVFYNELQQEVLWQLLFLLLICYPGYLGLSILINKKIYTSKVANSQLDEHLTGAVAVAGAGAVAVAVAVAGAGAGAVAVTLTVVVIVQRLIISDNTPSFTSIADFLQQLPQENINDIISTFTLFFLLLPMLNAFLDYGSVAFSRHMFAKTTEKKNGKYILGYWRTTGYLLQDVLIALGAKLSVLFLLYISANIFLNSGATFDPEQIKNYFALLFPLSSTFSPETFSCLVVATKRPGILEYPEFLLISLMIATTLLPTVLHFLWASLYMLVKAVDYLLRYLLWWLASSRDILANLIAIVLILLLTTVVAFFAGTGTQKAPPYSVEITNQATGVTVVPRVHSDNSADSLVIHRNGDREEILWQPAAQQQAEPVDRCQVLVKDWKSASKL